MLEAVTYFLPMKALQRIIYRKIDIKCQTMHLDRFIDVKVFKEKRDVR